MRKYACSAVEAEELQIDEKDGKTCRVFDEVQNEIFKLLKLNLWDKFKQDPVYQISLSKLEQKRAQRMMRNSYVLPTEGSQEIHQAMEKFKSKPEEEGKM